ncbi:MAG TPA: 4-hydroxy-tetrahydrodipicolinate synthase [bacterium]|nr:4-hydroxy-tetrahydrodipicolinate synthase [bacterium]
MKKVEFRGAWTALVTPMRKDGSVDWAGLEKNIEFQIREGITGILPAGTTGESPTLTYKEHNAVIKKTVKLARGRCFVLAGTGANSVAEAEEFTEKAEEAGADACLLVDPYYNGPSSLEIREEYYATLAQEFPDMFFMPYIIPGRTGCALAAEDLAVLAKRYKNIRAVKEATGDMERMRLERKLLPKHFMIMSGDDDMTFAMMTDPAIAASGVVSVMSNIVPGWIEKMCRLVLKGKKKEAAVLKNKLDPFFKLVTVTADRKEILEGKEYIVKDKFRNPLALKTIMKALGMPSGLCRKPLGRMTEQGIEKIRTALKDSWVSSPEMLKPVEKFYGVSLEDRIRDDSFWKELTY